jgi:hypothetical protein
MKSDRIKGVIKNKAASDGTYVKKRIKDKSSVNRETVKSTTPFKSKDRRSIFSESRAKDRANETWSNIKKASALLQYAPIVGPYAVGVNSAMGATDAYFNYKSNDIKNAKLDALSAIPIPSYKIIKSLGSGLGKKAKDKATRAAIIALGLDAYGTSADLTNNFKK